MIQERLCLTLREACTYNENNRAQKKKSSEGRLARYQNVRAELSNQARLSRFMKAR